MIEELAQGLILSDGTRFRPIHADVMSESRSHDLLRSISHSSRAHALSCTKDSSMMKAMSPAYMRWIEMALTEGKNQEIRKIWRHFGFPVCRLIRVAYGPFKLNGLQPGQVENVEGARVKAILRDLDSSMPP